MRDDYPSILHRVSEHWATVLSRPGVGIADHFLELGGDSVSAAFMAAALADEFDVEMNVLTIFHQPTVERLSRYIYEQQKNPGD